MPDLLQLAPDVLLTIAEWRIVRYLGSGGSGAVYLAERLEASGQQVAIKIFLPQPAVGESSALVSLNHPGIARYLDRGTLTNGSSYVVMEFVDGEPLDAYAERHALDVVERVGLLIAVAEAVEYAHSRFVIHADLKPANIFVTKAGAPRLLDFGIAVALGDLESASTRFTPRFSSPEQQFGQKLTVACDIFSLGATTRALCGNASSPELNAIIDKSCQAEPQDRYRTAQEFSNDLRAFTEHRPVAAYRKSKLYVAERWVRRNRITSSLIAALFAIILMSTLVVSIETIRAAQRRRVAQTRVRELASLTGKLQGELYASLPAGDGAADARRQLLAETVQTLQRLSADDQQDPPLRRELATQYRHLAALQEQQGDTTGAAASQRSAAALERP